METETKKKRTKEDLARELDKKREQIEQRLASLQEEVTSVGPSIRKAVFKHPLVGVGGALLAGLVVGLLVGGKRRSKKAYGAGADHRALVDHYVGAVVDEARHRIMEGQDVDGAVRDALNERVPLIVYEVPEGDHKPGVVGQLMGLVLRQVVPLGIQMGVDLLKGAPGEQPSEGEG